MISESSGSVFRSLSDADRGGFEMLLQIVQRYFSGGACRSAAHPRCNAPTQQLPAHDGGIQDIISIATPPIDMQARLPFLRAARLIHTTWTRSITQSPHNFSRFWATDDTPIFWKLPYPPRYFCASYFCAESDNKSAYAGTARLRCGAAAARRTPLNWRLFAWWYAPRPH